MPFIGMGKIEGGAGLRNVDGKNQESSFERVKFKTSISHKKRRWVVCSHQSLMFNDESARSRDSGASTLQIVHTPTCY